MSVTRSVEDKVADWLVAFRAVQEELSPPELRTLASLSYIQNMKPEDINIPSVNVGLAAARVLFANDRAAATVAALLTQSGIKPTALDYGHDET